ncbi:MAG: DUF2905 domain-containing protein [Phycisphaerae bacterium]|nr:DUF2905 domain-containing protein [Phycisphaerae bacterium]
MNNFPDNLAKMLIYAGAFLLIAGAIVFTMNKLGFFRLGGDIEMGGKNWKLYIPLGTCIIISIVLTGILWLISLLRK